MIDADGEMIEGVTMSIMPNWMLWLAILVVVLAVFAAPIILFERKTHRKYKERSDHDRIVEADDSVR